MKNLILSNRFFYGFLILELLLCSYFFYDNQVMEGILRYYDDFVGFFQSGFSSSYVFREQAPTYPMWGYSVLLLLTHNKTLIIILQQLFFVFTIWLTEQKIRSWYQRPDIFIYRLIVLLSFCLFFFHAIVWPYSFNANLLFLALLFSIEYIRERKASHLWLSACLLGISMNLRSDFLYFVPFLFVITFLFSRKHLKLGRNLLNHGVALAILLALLAPWMVHAYRKTGHVLTNSTNAGHVLYISLGQLPGNKWKITPLDGDSSMAYIVNEIAHEPHSATFRADSILKEKWFDLVKSDPGEFTRKCMTNLKVFLIKPFYTPDFYTLYMKPDELQRVKDEMVAYISGFQISKILGTLFQHADVFLVPALFALLNVILHLFFWVTIIRAVWKRNLQLLGDPVFLILLGFIGYQISFQTLAYYFASYHTNVYLAYLLLVVHFRSVNKRLYG